MRLPRTLRAKFDKIIIVLAIWNETYKLVPLVAVGKFFGIEAEALDN